MTGNSEWSALESVRLNGYSCTNREFQSGMYWRGRTRIRELRRNGSLRKREWAPSPRKTKESGSLNEL